MKNCASRFYIILPHKALARPNLLRTDAPYALFTLVSNPYLTRCKPVFYKNHLHSTYTTVTHYEHEIMPMKWNFC